MTIDLARLSAGDLLVPADAPEPVGFAADELSAYLARLFGTAPRRRAVTGPPGAWLALAGATPEGRELPALEPGLEYVVRRQGDGAVIAGRTPGALVAAAYALLEATGCRWSPHGPAAEHVPARDEARAIVPALAGRRAFARRAWAADLGTWHYSVPDRLAARLPQDRAFVDWMAKSGGTAFFFIRHANDTQWIVPELVPDLRRRGLAVEAGGHAIVELLPRALHADHPDYFPLGPAGRSDFGNLCAASAGALAIVRDRAAAARAEMAGATDLHLWGLDLLGGGWCACAACAGLGPSDQALRVCNAVADVGTFERVFHLAYHDTIDAPELPPHPRVWAEFAPRERCYGHALDDPACATNLRYRRALDEHLERFAGRVEVFEYYADAILFGGCALPLARVIERDLAFYERAAVKGVSCLIFGQYSLWAYGVNVEAFARGAVRPVAARGGVDAYCERRFGPAALPMARYLAALEQVMAAVVVGGDVLLPTDAQRPGLTAVLASEPALRGLLAEARAARGPAALLDAEERLLDYTLDALGAVREGATSALFEAIRHVRAVDASVAGSWGLYDLEITHHFFAAALQGRDR